MRDPERIDRIAEKLTKLWKRVPDQRLGQLVINLIRLEHSGIDPFFIEDTEWEKSLDNELSGVTDLV